MKIQPLLILLFCFLSVSVSGQDNEIEKMMSKRVLYAVDVRYNTILLIPKLYKEKKEDTIAALIQYYETNFGVSAPEYLPYIILNQIKTRTFKEEIKNLHSKKDSLIKVSDSANYETYIFSYYLQWYKDNFHISEDEEYALYFRNAYGNYFTFLASLSKELLNTKPLSPVERWLLNYFIAPNDSLYKQLDSSEFDGSLLKKAWRQYHNDLSTIYGTNISILSGVWIPDGNLAILGNHPIIGFTGGGKSKSGFLYDLRMDYRFLRTPGDYFIPVDTITFKTHHFFGLNWGLDFGYQIFRHRKNEFDVMAGIAWEYFKAISSRDVTKYNFGSSDGEYNSLNLNAGLTYRRYLTHKIKKDTESWPYLSLQMKYNFLFFNNNGSNAGGSEFSGGAWSITLSYGSISRKMTHYPINNN